MPATTRTLQLDSLATEFSVARLVDQGTLIHVTAHNGDTPELSATTYGSISLEVTGDKKVNRVAILAQGEIGAGKSISWDGDIEVEADYTIRLRAWSTVSSLITLGIVTE